jgi:hypothetical protein
MIKILLYIFIMGTTAFQLQAQEKAASEGTGIDFSPALLIYADAYQNPLIKFNIEKNRLGAGFIFSNTSDPDYKVVGINLVFDRIIFFNKHLDFYFEAGPAYFQRNYLKYNYTNNFSYYQIRKYNHLNMNLMCGFRYFPFGRWFFLSFDGGMAYNVLDQAPDENLRLYLPRRFGMGWLFYIRKY